jgi:hypothetical protein
VATAYGFTDLKKGTVWEHYASTCVRDGELNGRYELTADAIPINRLTASGHTLVLDPILNLRNLETGGVATIFSQALREGPLRQPHPHWKLAD